MVGRPPPRPLTTRASVVSLKASLKMSGKDTPPSARRKMWDTLVMKRSGMYGQGVAGEGTNSYPAALKPHPEARRTKSAVAAAQLEL